MELEFVRESIRSDAIFSITMESRKDAGRQILRRFAAGLVTAVLP